MNDQTSRLARLPIHHRAAFAAACAERVLRIYKLDYNGSEERPSTAVDHVWNFAEGQQANTGSTASLRDGLGEATPNIEREGREHTASMMACVSALSALSAVSDVTGSSAADASQYALEAIQSFEDHRGEGHHSEKAWQESTIDLLESLEAQPVTREMLRNLGEAPPPWFPWKPSWFS